ncbi:MAG: deaminase [Solirubrobacterales bacterium]|nr:deaminase [Solirubrobacterales bacterium]
MRIVVVNHITLDGVMQSPGRADEDTRGGFAHGGWANARSDEAVTRAVGERMGTPGGGMLLGRRSYEDMLATWNERGGPFKEGLNAAHKYVVSSDPELHLPWPNSTLVSGDVAAAVAGLKASPGGNLVVMGSGELIRSLLPHGLIDEFLLFVHPLLLGSGRRLFEHPVEAAELQLLSSSTTETGVLTAAYRRR